MGIQLVLCLIYLSKIQLKEKKTKTNTKNQPNKKLQEPAY